MEATKTAMPSNAEEGGEEEVEGGVRKARERKKKKEDDETLWRVLLWNSTSNRRMGLFRSTFLNEESYAYRQSSRTLQQFHRVNQRRLLT